MLYCSAEVGEGEKERQREMGGGAGQCCVWLRLALVVHPQTHMGGSGGSNEHAQLLHVIWKFVLDAWLYVFNRQHSAQRLYAGDAGTHGAFIGLKDELKHSGSGTCQNFFDVSVARSV